MCIIYTLCFLNGHDTDIMKGKKKVTMRGRKSHSLPSDNGASLIEHALTNPLTRTSGKHKTVQVCHHPSLHSNTKLADFLNRSNHLQTIYQILTFMKENICSIKEIQAKGENKKKLQNHYSTTFRCFRSKCVNMPEKFHVCFTCCLYIWERYVSRYKTMFIFKDQRGSPLEGTTYLPISGPGGPHHLLYSPPPMV